MSEPAPIYYRRFLDDDGSWYQAAGIAARTPEELAERLRIPRDSLRPDPIDIRREEAERRHYPSDPPTRPQQPKLDPWTGRGKRS
jgi:hypothetical protein